jgi:hypothetical protein
MDHNQDQESNILSNNISPIMWTEFSNDVPVQCGQNLEDILVQGGQNLEEKKKATRTEIFDLNNTPVQGGQNLNKDGGIFGDNFEGNSIEEKSPIEHLKEIISLNEQTYDLSKTLNFVQYRELSENERRLYVPLRGNSGIVFMKKTA